MKDITVIFADAKDEAAIKNLLLEAGLPHEDISNHLHHFLWYINYNFVFAPH